MSDGAAVAAVCVHVLVTAADDSAVTSGATCRPHCELTPRMQLNCSVDSSVDNVILRPLINLTNILL